MKFIEVPEGVKIIIERRIVSVTGKNGTLTQDFSHAPISIKTKEDKVTVTANWPHKKEAALVGTISSHIENMIKGVTEGFEYRLKIVYSHFPLTVEPKGKEVLIKNYIGERSPRIAKVQGEKTTVRVEGDDVIVEGINKEDVAQTAANIQQSTKLKGRLRKDFRVFMDGVYIYSKGK